MGNSSPRHAGVCGNELIGGCGAFFTGSLPAGRPSDNFGHILGRGKLKDDHGKFPGHRGAFKTAVASIYRNRTATLEALVDSRDALQAKLHAFEVSGTSHRPETLILTPQVPPLTPQIAKEFIVAFPKGTTTPVTASSSLGLKAHNLIPQVTWFQPLRGNQRGLLTLR